MYINLITVKGNYHHVLFSSRIATHIGRSLVGKNKLFKYYLLAKVVKSLVCIAYIVLIVLYLHRVERNVSSLIYV